MRLTHFHTTLLGSQRRITQLHHTTTIGSQRRITQLHHTTTIGSQRRITHSSAFTPPSHLLHQHHALPMSVHHGVYLVMRSSMCKAHGGVHHFTTRLVVSACDSHIFTQLFLVRSGASQHHNTTYKLTTPHTNSQHMSPVKFAIRDLQWDASGNASTRELGNNQNAMNRVSYDDVT